MPPRVVAFDVNETLLDMSGLDPHFEAAFGLAARRRARALRNAGLDGRFDEILSADQVRALEPRREA